MEGISEHFTSGQTQAVVHPFEVGSENEKNMCVIGGLYGDVNGGRCVVGNEGVDGSVQDDEEAAEEAEEEAEAAEEAAEAAEEEEEEAAEEAAEEEEEEKEEERNMGDSGCNCISSQSLWGGIGGIIGAIIGCVITAVIAGIIAAVFVYRIKRQVQAKSQ